MTGSVRYVSFIVDNARIRGPFRDPQSGDRIIERVRANIARYQSLIS